MIRNIDIKAKQKKIDELKTEASKLETKIAQEQSALDMLEEEGYFCAQDEFSIQSKEKKLEKLNEQIKEKEHALKVLKGEVEPEHVKPWIKSRPSSETNIITFLEVA